ALHVAVVAQHGDGRGGRVLGDGGGVVGGVGRIVTAIDRHRHGVGRAAVQRVGEVIARCDRARAVDEVAVVGARLVLHVGPVAGGADAGDRAVGRLGEGGDLLEPAVDV